MEAPSNPTDLRGERLSSLSFVWSYLELGFNGAVVRFLVLPTIECERDALTPVDDQYCSVLRSLIGKRLTGLRLEEHNALIELAFENGTRVWLPMSVHPDPSGERLHFVPGIGLPIQVW